MADKDKFIEFLKAKDLCVANLNSLKSSLIQCVDEKRVDMEESLYDQVLVCLEGASLMESWEEIEQLIFHAKILEEEIDGWLSIHELTSYSLTWPKKPSSIP